MGRGISDIVCLNYDTVCTSGNGSDAFAFLVSTLSNGNVPFIGDAMVGLTPNPETANVRSFGQQLLHQGSIDKHIVSIKQDGITFGAYDSSKEIDWIDFAFDGNLKNWAFKTTQMHINEKLFLDNETLVIVQNFVPGTYISTTDPQLPNAFASAAMATSDNITCSVKNKVASCMFKNQTCANSTATSTFRNMTFDTKIGKIFHFSPDTYLKQVGPDCVIQITVDATQQFTQAQPRDVIYIGQDLFDNYYVVLDFDS